MVKAVVAVFMKMGYRTTNQYLSDAMQRHKKRRDVSAPLAQQVRASERACRRGLGPPDKKDPLDFPELAQHSKLPDLVVIAVWYLMREKELETANMADLRNARGLLGLHFPTRKADQEMGWIAYRECICSGSNAARSWWCPSCAMKRQAGLREAQLTDSRSR